MRSGAIVRVTAQGCDCRSGLGALRSNLDGMTAHYLEMKKGKKKRRKDEREKKGEKKREKHVEEYFLIFLFLSSFFPLLFTPFSLHFLFSPLFFFCIFPLFISIIFFLSRLVIQLMAPQHNTICIFGCVSSLYTPLPSFHLPFD